MNIPGIFLDSDVVFAGPASPSEHGASHVILCMGEISLIECIVSRQVVVEVERNLAAKLPAKLPVFRQIMKHALLVVRDTLSAELVQFKGQAEPKDLPLLATSIRESCSYLLTFNLRHYHPTSNKLMVRPPGEFLSSIRQMLSIFAMR
jgi:predicted nucleic acid-binding protein